MGRVVLDVSDVPGRVHGRTNVREAEPMGDGGERLRADVARQLLSAGLLDKLRVHLVPLLLGAGTPLFDGEQAELISEGKPVTGTVTHCRCVSRS
jgi:riboflavin biosynthesis pyrimidine reductase